VKRPRGGGGLEIRKVVAQGCVCPRDKSLLLLKREMLMLEPALALCLAREYNQATHKAKATPGSMFRTRTGEKTELFFMDLMGTGTRQRVIVTFSSQ